VFKICKPTTMNLVEEKNKNLMSIKYANLLRKLKNVIEKIQLTRYTSK
jgi:hypothetical protein